MNRTPITASSERRLDHVGNFGIILFFNYIALLIVSKAVVTVLMIIFNSVSSTLFIAIASAQETPAPSAVADVVTPEQPSAASSSAVPTEASAPSVTPTPSSDPGPVPTSSPWKNSDNSNFETINNVEINKEYIVPQNDKIKVKFTSVSENSGKLSIKEVRLTADRVSQTGALSDTAYEITSTMVDNTFFYDLTLPIPPEAQNKEIDVKSSETLVPHQFNYHVV